MKLGFLADGHGNVEAFDRGLQVLQDAGAERIYFLGDAIGYLPGQEILERLCEDALPCVLGNHEAMLFDSAYPAEKEPIYRIRETLGRMSAELFDYVYSWPSERQLDAQCGLIRLVHGSPSDPTFGYVFPDTHLSKFGISPGVTVLMANTHRPFIRDHNGAIFVNIGSCGLPRDCGNLGSVCLLDDITGEPTVLRFDITSETEAALARCGPVAKAIEDIFYKRREENCFGVRFDK